MPALPLRADGSSLRRKLSKTLRSLWHKGSAATRLQIDLELLYDPSKSRAQGWVLACDELFCPTAQGATRPMSGEGFLLQARSALRTRESRRKYRSRRPVPRLRPRLP